MHQDHRSSGAVVFVVKSAVQRNRSSNVSHDKLASSATYR